MPRASGFTLVECATLLAVAAVLAAVALPTFRGDALRAARLDAVQALMRLQAAQERYRSAQGDYAPELSRLQGVPPVSDQGRYMISVARTGPEAYRATAQARGAQAGDTRCPALTLDVHQGFANIGPEAHCWNR